MMVARLVTVVRDNAGYVHPAGEAVEVIGEWRELGTHRVLLKAVWANGNKAILLPADVQMVTL
jgi:hypothetical protein